MGSGKTTIGRRIARELGFEFIDLDREIETRNGVSVATIFEIEGELGFRQRESQLLAELIQTHRCILATGGGAVLNPQNRTRLMTASCVVYLWATPQLLYARTKNDRTRPLLQVTDPLARITQLVRQRDPLYREVADVVVESGREMTTVIEQIKTDVERLCKL